MTAREDAEIRLEALAALEQHARDAVRARIANAFVQQPAPHTFHDAAVHDVSPRRGQDFPDQPGGPSSDFDGCVA